MTNIIWPCCGRLVGAAWSCLAELEDDDGDVRSRIRYGDETWYAERGWVPRERCADCAVRLSFYHHITCDKEQCPRCLGQMLRCLHVGCSGRDARHS